MSDLNGAAAPPAAHSDQTIVQFVQFVHPFVRQQDKLTALQNEMVLDVAVPKVWAIAACSHSPAITDPNSVTITSGAACPASASQQHCTTPPHSLSGFTHSTTAPDKLQIQFNSWAEQSIIQKQDAEQSWWIHRRQLDATVCKIILVGILFPHLIYFCQSAV